MLRTSLLRAARPLRQTPALTRLYHEKVIDHYERPRNVGSLNKNDIDVGTGLYPPPFHHPSPLSPYPHGRFI
jgi:iron-sulfur cluster assembly enzyme ISCU, mitochondrial